MNSLSMVFREVYSEGALRNALGLLPSEHVELMYDEARGEMVVVGWRDGNDTRHYSAVEVGGLASVDEIGAALRESCDQVVRLLRDAPSVSFPDVPAADYLMGGAL